MHRVLLCELNIPKSFQADGLKILINAALRRLAHNSGSVEDFLLLMEIVGSYKSLMNNLYSMQKVLGTEKSIETLTMCLDFRCPPLARSVLEILAVTCYFSSEGVQLVTVGRTFVIFLFMEVSGSVYFLGSHFNK